MLKVSNKEKLLKGDRKKTMLYTEQRQKLKQTSIQKLYMSEDHGRMSVDKRKHFFLSKNLLLCENSFQIWRWNKDFSRQT